MNWVVVAPFFIICFGGPALAGLILWWAGWFRD
jgi:hypothetical protein